MSPKELYVIQNFYIPYWEHRIRLLRRVGCLNTRKKDKQKNYGRTSPKVDIPLSSLRWKWESNDKTAKTFSIVFCSILINGSWTRINGTCKGIVTTWVYNQPHNLLKYLSPFSPHYQQIEGEKSSQNSPFYPETRTSPYFRIHFPNEQENQILRRGIQ